MAEETFAERLWEGIDEAVEPYDVPNELVEMLKKDLKGAFDVKGTARPGYEPGAVAFAKFNLIDAVTQPGKTVQETIGSIFENKSRPSVPLLWTDAEEDVWEKLFFDPTIGWVDPTTGSSVVPPSLQQATLRWNERARLRITRVIAEERGIFENPGLTLMMARRLNDYYGPGTFLPAIVSDAGRAEQQIRQHLANAEMAEEMGDRVGALAFWGAGDKAQKKWAEDSKAYRDRVRKDFERISRLGSQANTSVAAHALANSPEAQFWRYWQTRRLYFQTLNFLNTWRKEGFWGVVKVYAWNWAVLKTFGLKPEAGAPLSARLRYYSYPAHALNWVVVKVAEKVRLIALVNKITEAKAWFARTWKRFIATPLKKGFEFIRDRIIRQAARWLIAKLGLKVILAKIGAAIGGAIGTAAGPVGSAVGAIVMAVVSFIGGLIAEKMMKPVLQGTLYLFAGACGCLALAVAGMAMFMVLVVGSIFAPGAPGGAPGPGPGPTPSPVEIEKEVGRVTPGGVEYRDVLKYPVTPGVTYTFRWRVVVTNTSTASDAAVNDFHDDICESDPASGWQQSFSLVPEESKTFECPTTYDLGTERTIINLAVGKATVDGVTKPISDMAKIIIGEEQGCQLNVPFFCQSDPQWKDTGCCWPSGSYSDCKPEDKDTIGNAGCGCTSQAMIINYHGGSTTPPQQCGTYGCHVNNFTADYDLPCGPDDMDAYFEEVRRYLCDQNRPIIAIRDGTPGNDGPGGEWDHYAVITGIDPVAKQVTLNDPYFAYSFCVPGLHMSFEDFFFYARAATQSCLIWYNP